MWSKCMHVTHSVGFRILLVLERHTLYVHPLIPSIAQFTHFPCCEYMDLTLSHRVEAPTIDHLGEFAPNLEKYKAMPIFFSCVGR